MNTQRAWGPISVERKRLSLISLAVHAQPEHIFLHLVKSLETQTCTHSWERVVMAFKGFAYLVPVYFFLSVLVLLFSVVDQFYASYVVVKSTELVDIMEKVFESCITVPLLAGESTIRLNAALDNVSRGTRL